MKFSASALLAVSVILAFPNSTLKAERAGSCNVLVRVLEGTNGANSQKVIPAALKADIGMQLDTLPYDRFSLLDARKKLVGFGTQGVFELRGHEASAHRLEVSPHSISGNRVSVTIRWTGSDSKELVSTKMRVANGKCVVLGADRPAAATILAVKLECGSRES